MKIHVLVEGPSEKAFMDRWAPRTFKGHQFVIHPHQGKGTLPKNPASTPDPRHRGLLDVLPATLRAYASSPQMQGDAVLVLVDADDEDCIALKNKLTSVVREITPLRIVIRIAVEEFEAFYLGDLSALKTAYPNADMSAARAYQPDSIIGTAELFGRIIGDNGIRKIMWAEGMGARVTTDPSKSRSPSFKALYNGFTKLLAMTPRRQPRKKHWKSRHPSLRKKGQQGKKNKRRR